MLSKITHFCKENSKDLFLVIIILLTALISFGLGRLSKLEEDKTPLIINQPATPVVSTNTAINEPINTKTANQGGEVVASKNGTKYHFPWCSGAQSIKEENKITFASIEKARKAGYTPASNCKGLE